MLHVYLYWPVEIWIHGSNRRRRSRFGAQGNWQSFLAVFSPLHYGRFHRSLEFLVYASKRVILSLSFFYSRNAFDQTLLLPRGSWLSKYFVIPENGVFWEETDFIPERVLYARLSPIFLFLVCVSRDSPSLIRRNLDAENTPLHPQEEKIAETIRVSDFFLE